MLRHIAHAALIVSLWIPHALAGADSAAEWALETDTVSTSLPSSIPSRLTTRSCLACKDIPLTLDSTSRFYLDGAPTSLAEIGRKARTKRFMMVFYRPTTRVVTRIVVRSAAPR